MKKFIIFIYSFFLIVSCNEINKGVITNKYVEKEKTVTHYIFTGKSCFPIINTIPKKYIIVIKDSTYYSHKEVNEEIYNKYNIGDSIELK